MDDETSNACADGKGSRDQIKRRSVDALWRRMKHEGTILRDILAQLLSPALRLTSILLPFVWFGNAIVYYGLVFLVTTVRFAVVP